MMQSESPNHLSPYVSAVSDTAFLPNTPTTNLYVPLTNAPDNIKRFLSSDPKTSPLRPLAHHDDSDVKSLIEFTFEAFDDDTQCNTSVESIEFKRLRFLSNLKSGSLSIDRKFVNLNTDKRGGLKRRKNVGLLLSKELATITKRIHKRRAAKSALGRVMSASLQLDRDLYNSPLWN